LDKIKATVQTVIPQARHGPFAVATSDQIKEGSVTFSLEPTVWQEKEWPEPGSVVLLEELRKKRLGWRAQQGRFWQPSDEQSQQTARREKMNADQDTFRSFLVDGGRDRKNIFRVIALTGGVTRKQIEKLLENLPIGFRLGKDILPRAFEDLNEPLEVRVDGAVISIYPPRHRVIANTAFDSYRRREVTSLMNMDNVMDTFDPGHGQIRTCVHFDPAILGITDWANLSIGQVEVDFHVYPESKTREPNLKAPTFSKGDTLSLLDLIAGGREERLTVAQLQQWRELIMYAVMSLYHHYENPNVAEDDPTRVYYRPCWAEIEAAGKDDEKLITALEKLMGMIEMQ
jgi:hypothetical protein